MEVDERYMQMALELARRGKGTVSPNPMVGAVLVNRGEITGTGFHQEPGSPHAEVIALENAGDEAREGTLYINLEPCSHYGRTPPCVDAIIKAGVKKVVIAMEDPNPRVAGTGKAKLRQAGIQVVTGVLEDKALQLNEVFVKYITTGRPFVIVKTAMTLDGKISTRTGDSRWITGEASREVVHKIRHEVDGIVVGIGTVLKDDPALTTRLEGGKDATRIVIDAWGRLPRDSRIINPSSTADLIWVVGEDIFLEEEEKKDLSGKGVKVLKLPSKNGEICLASLLEALAQREISSLLVEGGGTLNYGFLKENLVDKVYMFIAPLLCGGKEAVTPFEGKGIAWISQAWKVKKAGLEYYGDDLLFTGYPGREM